MNASTTTVAPAVDDLRARVAGDVVVPGDDRYDVARLAWNLTADQHPALIALAETAQDVVEIVRYARANGLRVAPQGTGHGAAALESLESTVLLKTTRMRRVTIDVEMRSARAEAGAIWTDVTEPAAEHGLVALHGSSPNVGVVGYSLGGGMGWLARSHGLAANSVTAVEIVTADGRLHRVDHETEPELFWALRGGGGSYGVVTAIEFDLYPMTEIYAGWLIFPIERSSEVLHAWREWTQTVPDEVTSVGRILRLPPLPDIPEPLRGRQIVVIEAAYQGSQAEGDALIAPLRELGPEMDTFGVMPAAGLVRLHQDPEDPVPGSGDGSLLASGPADAIDAFVEAAGPGSGCTLLSAELRHIGAAVGRRVPGSGAARLDGEYAMFAVGMALTPEMGEATAADVRRIQAALKPWRAAYNYFNFSESGGEGEEQFDSETYALLQEVKERFDADEMIVSNHPIRPAR
jgi:UDP-N-acetylenolpyruvoylglucosamine reductase